MQKRKKKQKQKDINSPSSILGAGLGLRSQHLSIILSEYPEIPWFEILSENYFAEGGLNLKLLDEVCESYPVVMHGVGMSLGQSTDLSKSYLEQLKNLKNRTKAAWLSDHCSWGANGPYQLHDLLPVAYNKESLENMVSKVKQVQDFFSERILIENISAYLDYHSSSMPEWEFLRLLTEKADCNLLLDINNVYVSSINQGFKPRKFLDAIPHERVKQIHLAGHSETPLGILLDTHSREVKNEVWDLYTYFLQKAGPIPTLVEWDIDIPEFHVLAAEAKKAQIIMDEV